MYKILSLDYGSKFTGLAITNNIDKMIYGLCTLNTNKLFVFIKKYVFLEKIKIIIIGYPKFLNNQDMKIENDIKIFINKFLYHYPKIIIKRIDERYTSKISKYAFYDFIKKKKKRKTKKYIIHQMSAIMLLQSYLYLNKSI